MENINVKALVRLVGINESTLRAWERRHRVVSPARSENGRRLYNHNEVERIKLLWSLVKEGHTIGTIASLPNEELKELLSSSLSPEASIIKASAPLTESYLKQVLKTLETFDVEALNHTLQKARFDMSSKDIIINLIRPLMIRVGDLIHEGRFTITQEHLLSAFLRDYLGHLHQSLSPYDHASRSMAKRVVLTTREGDIHEFGILSAAILCNLYRLKSYYLGPNMPAGDLIEGIMQFQADIVVLGLMTLPKSHEIISPQDFLAELDRKLPRRVTICMGGTESIDLKRLNSERQFLVFKDLLELDRFLSDQS